MTPPPQGPPPGHGVLEVGPRQARLISLDTIGWLVFAGVVGAGLLAAWRYGALFVGVIVLGLPALAVVALGIGGVRSWVFGETPDLVLDDHGVRLVRKKVVVPHREVAMILTWTVDHHDPEKTPERFLAVVPRAAMPAVHAAPRPRIPHLGGPLRASGAPDVLDPFVVPLRRRSTVDELRVLATLVRWCPRAQVVELGEVPW